jgi:hypothetical protein
VHFRRYEHLPAAYPKLVKSKRVVLERGVGDGEREAGAFGESLERKVQKLEIRHADEGK